MTQLKELIKYRKSQPTNNALFGFSYPTVTGDIESYDFWNEYVNNYSAFDGLTRLLYKERFVSCVDESDEIAVQWEEFHMYCESVFQSHAYEYQRMWDALKVYYDPISNYDRTEETDITTDPRTDKTKNAAYTDKNKSPDVVTTNSGGTQTDITGASPYDDEDFSNVQKATTTVPQTTVTVGAATVEIEHGAHTDELEHGEEHTNTKSHVFGNVGVTTNQQMINQELALRQRGFIETIISDILRHVSFY